MKILFDNLLHVHYGQFHVLPPESNGVELIDAFSGQTNGLCGAAVQQHLLLITGLHTGRVHVRVGLCDEVPAKNDLLWEEIVEASFDVAQVPVVLEEWAGTARYELAIPSGQYRVRYMCRLMDQGRELDTTADDNEVAPDSYELLFWPQTKSADAILKQASKVAAYWHEVARESGAALNNSCVTCQVDRSVVKFQDLLLAFDFVSSGAPMEHEAYLCKETGVIHWHSEYGDVEEEELPGDIDSDKYVEIPHKNDLDLGKRLVLKFAAEFLPDEYDKVGEIFSRRGAYVRFKELLERNGKLQQWYDYEEKAQNEALRAWCEDNGIEIDG